LDKNNCKYNKDLMHFDVEFKANLFKGKALKIVELICKIRLECMIGMVWGKESLLFGDSLFD